MTAGFAIFLVRFSVTRPPKGGFINAWIKARDADEAVARARQEIEKIGWTPLTLDEVSRPRPECPGRDYHQQAMTDNEVLVVYEAPLDG
jgi:hypothetical protein